MTQGMQGMIQVEGRGDPDRRRESDPRADPGHGGTGGGHLLDPAARPHGQQTAGAGGGIAHRALQVYRQHRSPAEGAGLIDHICTLKELLMTAVASDVIKTRQGDYQSAFVPGIAA